MESEINMKIKENLMELNVINKGYKDSERKIDRKGNQLKLWDILNPKTSNE